MSLIYSDGSLVYAFATNRRVSLEPYARSIQKGCFKHRVFVLATRCWGSGILFYTPSNQRRSDHFPLQSCSLRVCGLIADQRAYAFERCNRQSLLDTLRAQLHNCDVCYSRFLAQIISMLATWMG